MSATNTTTNYNLPIFLSSDKPAWLVDFNGAMTAIDTQMKVNADAIATKSPILTFSDTTDIDFTVNGSTVEANLDAGVAGTISRAFTRPVAAPASPQIPSVDTSNAQQLLTVGTGLKIDSGSLNAVDLDLSDIINVPVANFTEVTSNVTLSGNGVTFALNSDRSIGKIYGNVNAITTSSSITGFSAYTGVTVPNPDNTEYVIWPSGIILAGGNPVKDFGGAQFRIAANGKVYVEAAMFGGANTKNYVYYFPSIYFFKDFGDTPTP